MITAVVVPPPPQVALSCEHGRSRLSFGEFGPGICLPVRVTSARMLAQRAVFGSSPSHFQKLALDVDRIEVFEDGLRTDPDRVGFEWWNFDCRLDEGEKLTIEFHTKPPYISPSKPLTPYVVVTLQPPSGELVQRTLTAPAEQFAASREQCDVRIGKNTFQGDLKHYRIHIELDDLELDLVLNREVPSWRPATGHAFFGNAEEYFVAWLVAVPRGSVAGRMSLGGVTRELSGVGYHDHNWGNIALRKLVDHWYWGRAHIGDYTAVTLMAYANETYGKVASPAFMLAKGNEIVVSNAEHVRFSEAEPGVVAQTGVPMANRLCYEYEHGSDHYKLTYVRRADNYTLDFGPVGAYQRFVGDVVLDRRVDGRALPTLHADALWELLYFGPR